MKITLLHPDIQDKNVFKEEIAGKASALCIGKLKSSLSYNDNLQAAVSSNHLSVIEHLPLSFLIEDISRACSHQLVRHRHFSFSQISQRYSKINWEKDWYIKPNSINNRDTEFEDLDTGKTISSEQIYENIMLTIASAYHTLLNAGVPLEDARYVLPNACFTSIIVSMNARTFAEACTKRMCNKAQWEIRDLFIQMRELIKDIYPNIYYLCFPNCEKEIGCQETYPCNKERI